MEDTASGAPSGKNHPPIPATLPEAKASAAAGPSPPILAAR